MKDYKFIEEYLQRYQKALLETDVTDKLIALRDKLEFLKGTGNKALIAGNGASASISSHVSVDFTKQGGVRTVNFNEANLITCFANDYRYENWVTKAVEFYADPGDLVILISSSGSSANIVNAAKHCKQNGIPLVTFSGFDASNPLAQEGDLNFWVNSKAYNVIENIHQIWLLMVCDMLVGEVEYSTS